LDAGEQPGALQSALLFRVEKGEQDPTYLFGTIHSEDPRVVSLPAVIEDAFARSEVLVMELVLDASTMLRSWNALLLEDGGDLEDIIGADLYRKSLGAVTALGYPALTIQRFKPWAVVTLLSVPPPDTGKFLDLVLYEKALSQGKPVYGLETVKEQLAPFDALSAEEQLNMLRSTIALRHQLPGIYSELVETYLRRDLFGLEDFYRVTIFAQGAGLAQGFKRGINQERNHRMVERMIPFLEKGSAFVAVGALHLPGPEGMLNLLREQGYRITPIY
jgi:uncharacterized protein YbaP (TraB family)